MAIQFTVRMKVDGRTDHAVVDAEDVKAKLGRHVSTCLLQLPQRASLVISAQVFDVVEFVRRFVRPGRDAQPIILELSRERRCLVSVKRGAPATNARAPVPVQCRLCMMRACRSARRDRQQVSAGARASPSWIGGRRRPTRS